MRLGNFTERNTSNCRIILVPELIKFFFPSESYVLAKDIPAAVSMQSEILCWHLQVDSIPMNFSLNIAATRRKDTKAMVLITEPNWLSQMQAEALFGRNRFSLAKQEWMLLRIPNIMSRTS